MKIEIQCGVVDTSSDHLVAEVRKRGGVRLLARLAPAVPARADEGTFIIEWCISRRTAAERRWWDEVLASLHFYMVELDEGRPWSYLCYHTGTAGNFYSAESGGVFWLKGGIVGENAEG